MSNRLPLSVLLPCLALIAYRCESVLPTVVPPVIPPGVWVTIDPIQCLGNPWEQDWLRTHKYHQYPRDERTRLRIFREYYEPQGITLYEVKASVWAEAVWAACSCPTGQRLHCRIDEDDLELMLALGITREG